MSTGGGFCKRLKVSQVTSGNSDAATSNLESRSSSSEKTVLSLSGNLEMSSTKVVHEQLECPICMNLMNPPIYQVLILLIFHTYRKDTNDIICSVYILGL